MSSSRQGPVERVAAGLHLRDDDEPGGTGDELVHTGPPAVETGDEPPTPRIVGPGGWKRALVGLLLGVAAGAAIGLVLPRDEGPRRTVPAGGRPRPFDP